MKLQGRPAQPARVDLPTLQTWLGKLLDLPSPPSVEECSKGKALLAALHLVSSTQPLVSTSYADMLIVTEPKSTTFAKLGEALAAAGLEDQIQLLDEVSIGNSEVLERLLLRMYQHYAVNHAHKFCRHSDSINAGQDAGRFRSGFRHSSYGSGPGQDMLQISTEKQGDVEDPRSVGAETSIASWREDSSEGVLLASAELTDSSGLEESVQQVESHAWLSMAGTESKVLHRESIIQQPAARSSQIVSKITEALEVVVETETDSDGSPSAFLVASLTAETPRQQEQHHQQQAPQAGCRVGPDMGLGLEGDGQDEDDTDMLSQDACSLTPEHWVPASQRCLIEWLGGVTGRRDPVGRMLLGNSSVAVKTTMLSNAAAHRSATAQIFGLPHPGSHATAQAEQNTAATLDAIEQALGITVSHELRAACLPEYGVQSLKAKQQLALGAAVAQASVVQKLGSNQLAPFPVEAAALELLDWADQLIVQKITRGSPSPESILYMPDGTVAWNRITFGVLCALIYANGCASTTELPPLEEAFAPADRSDDPWQPHADRLFGRLGALLPFRAGDLPAGPESSACLRALLLASLSDIRHCCGQCQPGRNIADEMISAHTLNEAEIDASSTGGTSVVSDTASSLQRRPMHLRPSSASITSGVSNQHFQQTNLQRPQSAAPRATARSIGSSRTVGMRPSLLQHHIRRETAKESARSSHHQAIERSSASGLERPKSSRGRPYGNSQKGLQPIGLLAPEDQPQRLSSQNGGTAEVLTLDAGDELLQSNSNTIRRDDQQKGRLGQASATSELQKGSARGLSSSLSVSKITHSPERDSQRPCSASVTPLEPLQSGSVPRDPHERTTNDSIGTKELNHAFSDAAKSERAALQPESSQLLGLINGPARGVSTSLAVKNKGNSGGEGSTRPYSASASATAASSRPSHQVASSQTEQQGMDATGVQDTTMEGVCAEGGIQEAMRHGQLDDHDQGSIDSAACKASVVLSGMKDGPVKGISASLTIPGSLVQTFQADQPGNLAGRRTLHYGTRPASASAKALAPLAAKPLTQDLCDSLVPENMFAAPSGAASTSLVQPALLSQADKRPVSREEDSTSWGSSSFLPKDVFAPPTFSAETTLTRPCSLPDPTKATTQDAKNDDAADLCLLDKVEATRGIGRFRSRGSEVSASLAVDPQNWVPCPELSSSTPHLNLSGAAAAERKDGTALSSRDQIDADSELEETNASKSSNRVEVLVQDGETSGEAQEVSEELLEEDKTNEDLVQVISTVVDGDGVYKDDLHMDCLSEEVSAFAENRVHCSSSSRSALLERMVDEAEQQKSVQKDQEPLALLSSGGEIGDSGSVASWLVKKIQGREQQHQLDMVEEGFLPDGLELTLGAAGSQTTGATAPASMEGALDGNSFDESSTIPASRSRYRSDEATTGDNYNADGRTCNDEELLEASLQPFGASSGLPQWDVTHNLRPQVTAHTASDAFVTLKQDPSEDTGVDALSEHRQISSQYDATAASQTLGQSLPVYGKPDGTEPQVPPSPGIISGAAPVPVPKFVATPPVPSGIAFEVAAIDKEAEGPQTTHVERERATKVQAMLDAKRERFLSDRKAKQQAAEERAAKEERQRKALTKQREAEAAARKHQQEQNQSPEKEAEKLVAAATPEKLSRPRQEVLAEASLPLDQHLALLVASSGDPVEGDSDPLLDGAQNVPQAPAPRRAPAPTNPPPPTFSRASNRKLIRNALCHVCLAGAARAKEKEAVLEALDSYKGDDSFIVLFKNSTMPLHFRGLYVHERKGGRVHRLYGKGPEEIEQSAVSTFFKYDSGSRDFKAMQTSGFTFGITSGIARM